MAFDCIWAQGPGYVNDILVSIHTVTARDMRSFEIRFELAVQFDSKVIGWLENFQIESAVPAPLIVASLVKRLEPLTTFSGTVYRLASSMSDHTLVV